MFQKSISTKLLVRSQLIKIKEIIHFLCAPAGFQMLKSCAEWGRLGGSGG